MEIVSAVNTDDWSTNHKCNHCDSVLKIKKTDLIYKYEKSNHYEQEDSHIYHIKCPVCTHLSFVHNNEIPKLVQLKIKNDKK